MKNGWSGGQYSLYRAIFGTYLCIHFVHLSFWGAEIFSSEGVLPKASDSPLLHAFPNMFALADGPTFVTGVLLAAATLSVLFAIGRFDRSAAVLLWYIWACLFGRNPLISNPGLPYVGWLLLAHAFLPAAPFGSLTAKGRRDPKGSWVMTPSIYTVAWILMAVGYSYSGYTKLISPSWLNGSALEHLLENALARPTVLREWLLATPPIFLMLAAWSALGLELLYAPLAIFRRVRPWIWLAMVGMHLGLLTLVDFADLTLGMLMIHFFTFDPAWVHAKRARAPDVLFYDGSCGLCHRTIRFILAEDPIGDRFRFAPLESDAYRDTVPEDRRKSLPDSVVIVSADGTIRSRSDAICYLLGRLGGLWRIVSWMPALVPRSLRDRGYDFVAVVRHRLFRRPKDVCPLMPSEYRRRWIG